MKIYIIGDSDSPYYDRHCAQAAEQLAAAGHTPVNPAAVPFGTSTDRQARLLAVVPLIAGCDYVALFPGWEECRAAKAEKAWAWAVGVPAGKLREWVNSR